MDENIEISNLKPEAIKEASRIFTDMFGGAVNDFSILIRQIKDLNNSWIGPKFNYFIERWNTEYSKNLKNILYNWDKAANATFSTIAEQYEAANTGELIDLEVKVNEDVYSFITDAIEGYPGSGTLYIKSEVDSILKNQIAVWLDNIPHQIRNTITIIKERVEGAQSTALTRYFSTLEELTNQYANDAKGYLEAFYNEIMNRQKEMDDTENTILSRVNSL